MTCMAAPSSCQGMIISRSATSDRLYNSRNFQFHGNRHLTTAAASGAGELGKPPVASTSGRGDVNHSRAETRGAGRGRGRLPGGRGSGRQYQPSEGRPSNPEAPSSSPAFFTTRIRQAASVEDLVSLCSPHVREVLSAATKGAESGEPDSGKKRAGFRFVLDHIATAAAMSRWNHGRGVACGFEAIGRGIE